MDRPKEVSYPCKTCKHHDANIITVFFEHLQSCSSPKNGISPVSGNLKQGFATLNREYEHKCGKDGRWHSKRPENVKV